MRIRKLSWWCTVTLVGVFAFVAHTAETNAPPDAGAKPEDRETQQVLRSYLQLQEQLHDTLLTIERSRKETEAAAKASADALAVRLDAIEKSMGTQQSHEVSLLQSSNRVTLIAAAIFATLGLFAMIFTAWFLLRAMNRLTTIAAGMGNGQALAPLHGSMFLSDSGLSNLRPVEPAAGRLLGAIERLEKRVVDLEHTSHVPLPPESTPQHNGSNAHPEETSGQRPSDRIVSILGKGQSLLSMDKAQEAIACFDEALALDPRHAEALVKKGTALERLKRLEEAIDCYDRAIGADRSMTLAYLYKGGACNQLERFNEALDCYEQALRSQQKKDGSESPR